MKDKETSSHLHRPQDVGPRISSLWSSLCYLDWKTLEGLGLCLSCFILAANSYHYAKHTDVQKMCTKKHGVPDRTAPTLLHWSIVL